MIDVNQIVKQTETLSGDEQLALAAILIERGWLDVLGVAPYPLTGEDAQTWVTRTRSEDEAERERQWGLTP